MFPCAPTSMPPATIGCALTPWVCTPKHPPLYTHVPMAEGGMAVLRGAVTPGKGWDAPALPLPTLCWPKG